MIIIKGNNCGFLPINPASMTYNQNQKFIMFKNVPEENVKNNVLQSDSLLFFENSKTLESYCGVF